jgi:hypothetical protein
MGGCCVMNNAIGDFFRDIFGDNSGGCAYSPGPSETEAHAKKIADELAEMKEHIRKSSEKNEKMIINNISEAMEELIVTLEKINNNKYGGKNLNINIDGIRKSIESLKKKIIGFIGDFMDDRLVLTDKELSIILEERDDQKRKINFDAFCKKIKGQALDLLIDMIKVTVRQQEKLIRKEIESRLNEVKKNLEIEKKAYHDILKTKNKDESEMSKTQIKLIYQYGVLDILNDQLGE